MCLARSVAQCSAASSTSFCTTPLQVRRRPRLASGGALQWQQLVALTRRNLLVRRAWQRQIAQAGTRQLAAPQGKSCHPLSVQQPPAQCALLLPTTCRCPLHVFSPPTHRVRAWKTNLLLVLQAVLFIALIWVVDRAGGDRAGQHGGGGQQLAHVVPLRPAQPSQPGAKRWRWTWQKMLMSGIAPPSALHESFLLAFPQCVPPDIASRPSAAWKRRWRSRWAPSPTAQTTFSCGRASPA